MRAPEFVRPHAEAVAAGIQGAGFVDVHVQYDEHTESFQAGGACPCGLGRSAFYLSRYGSTVKFGTPKIFQRLPSELQELAYKLAMKHIERDKAEGLWTP